MGKRSRTPVFRGPVLFCGAPAEGKRAVTARAVPGGREGRPEGLQLQCGGKPEHDEVVAAVFSQRVRAVRQAQAHVCPGVPGRRGPPHFKPPAFRIDGPASRWYNFRACQKRAKTPAGGYFSQMLRCVPLKFAGISPGNPGGKSLLPGHSAIFQTGPGPCRESFLSGREAFL